MNTEKKYIFTGSSSVQLFEPLKTQLNIKICRYPAVSIKDIVDKNLSYSKLVNTINKNYYSDIIFNFGVIDVNFNYYCEKYLKNNKNIFEKMKIYVVEYVKLISELNIKNKHILGITPSFIKSKYFKSMLLKYLPYNFNENNINLIPDSDCKSIARNLRIVELNNIIKTECNKYKINYCDIYNETTINNKGNKIFRLNHKSNDIHPKYEYLLLIYLNKCFKYINNKLDYEKLLDLLESNYNNYLKKSFNKNNIDIYYLKKFNKKQILNFINKLKF